MTKNSNQGGPALTPGYALIMRILVKSGLLRTFKRDFSENRLTWAHVLRVFRLDVLRQRILRNASLL